MIQLACALHAIGAIHIKDGIHSVARLFPFKLFNVSWPSTPGRGKDTQYAIGKWGRIITSVLSKLPISCELKMSRRESSEGPSAHRHSAMRFELVMTMPWPPRL